MSTAGRVQYLLRDIYFKGWIDDYFAVILCESTCGAECHPQFWLARVDWRTAQVGWVWGRSWLSVHTWDPGQSSMQCRTLGFENHKIINKIKYNHKTGSKQNTVKKCDHCVIKVLLPLRAWTEVEIWTLTLNFSGFPLCQLSLYVLCHHHSGYSW